ncbi:uncharacterized protein LOC120445699 isoform X1 [Drosophila santomea]|uniref:uncharacterized protein LOC120445699 isoform X1 n=1 Tax=Drosophila santomea TaxID=129105 RepID=UPI001954A587|nr:uncharacterized protein LOC120445699 isoform X1 [Drosophila santomea]
MATAACVRCAQQQQQKQQQQQHEAHAQQQQQQQLQQQRRNSPRILHIYCAWALITLLAASAAMVQSAAVFGDLLSHPTFKPLCSAQHEHFIESDGKESSLIIELKPGLYGAEHASCSRILSAPPNYGFIVRLILPKLPHGQPLDAATTRSTPTNIMAAAAGGNNSSKLRRTAKSGGMSESSEPLNATRVIASSTPSRVLGRTCPLNIFSSLDPHTAQWRVDPCQLEDTASEMEDPVRLFHGRVKIVWEHGQHALRSKLMVTVLGKGEQCKDGSKHQCLKIGDEPILCISKELACDGIRHCPYSNEYDSDEDYELCSKLRRPGAGKLAAGLESDLFEQFALEVFRNLFANDAPSAPEDLPRNGSDGAMGLDNSTVTSTTTLRKVHTKDMKKPGGDGSPNSIGPSLVTEGDQQRPENDTAEMGVGTGAGSGFTRRNSTRSGLHSDLSKYGPWGYLMLGMLLCGGALLICGLWASASQHAVNNEREAALAAANGGGNGGGDHLGATSPPNYEELDPPPAYSVLFPNQKAASSTTLNLDATAASTTAAAAAAAAAAATAAAATGAAATALAGATASESAQQNQQQQEQPTN